MSAEASFFNDVLGALRTFGGLALLRGILPPLLRHAFAVFCASIYVVSLAHPVFEIASGAAYSLRPEFSNDYRLLARAQNGAWYRALSREPWFTVAAVCGAPRSAFVSTLVDSLMCSDDGHAVSLGVPAPSCWGASTRCTSPARSSRCFYLLALLWPPYAAAESGGLVYGAGVVRMAPAFQLLERAARLVAAVAASHAGRLGTTGPVVSAALQFAMHSIVCWGTRAMLPFGGNDPLGTLLSGIVRARVAMRGDLDRYRGRRRAHRVAPRRGLGCVRLYRWGYYERWKDPGRRDTGGARGADAGQA